jgi:hypothetical protein
MANQIAQRPAFKVGPLLEALVELPVKGGCNPYGFAKGHGPRAVSRFHAETQAGNGNSRFGVEGLQVGRGL